MSDVTDDELVAAARAGDRGALDLLLRRHYDRVHAVCCRIAGRTRDADDATQETMIKIVRHLDRFDGRSAFGTWAYRIATNTALDELRKRDRRPALHAVDDDDDRRRGELAGGRAGDRADRLADRLAERTVEAAGERVDLDAALAALPADYRAAVVLRDVADLDYAEIADVLDVPIGTVKSRIARGRRLLADQLGNRTGTPRRPTGDTPRTPANDDP